MSVSAHEASLDLPPRRSHIPGCKRRARVIHPQGAHPSEPFFGLSFGLEVNGDVGDVLDLRPEALLDEMAQLVRPSDREIRIDDEMEVDLTEGPAQIVGVYEGPRLSPGRTLFDENKLRLEFDADGRLVQRTYPDGSLGFPSAVSAQYQYDARGLLSSIVDPTGIWRFEYDAAGRPVRRTDPGGIEERTAYTIQGFIDKIEVLNAGTVTQRHTYTNYDELGNPGTVTRLDNAVTTLAGLAGTSGASDGSGTAARFSSPQGVALDADGSMIVADTGNNAVRRVTTGGAVTTLATGLDGPRAVAAASST